MNDRAPSAGQLPPGGFRPDFRWRMLGTPAPVFPGFEIDICDDVEDHEKQDALWHRQRARAMLKAHPGIRQLSGQNPWTAALCVAVATAQIALAILMASQPIWLLIASAWLIGAWLNINLFMLAHECNHGLVFRNSVANRWLFTLTSLPMFLSAHHAWWIEHRVHHSALGAKKDFINRRRTFFLMTRYATPLLVPYSLAMLVMQMVRSALGLLLYVADLMRGRIRPGPRTLAILGDLHLVSGYEKNDLSRWALAYAFLGLAVPALLFATAGWGAVFYLLLSQTFMTGFLHPLLFGMVLSNSHFHGSRRYQPTSSYYGWLNRVSLNFGYHTEHHDIASIPWNRLPALRALAPEFYDSLYETRSYVGLARQFILAGKHDRELFDAEELRNAARLAGHIAPSR